MLRETSIVRTSRRSNNTPMCSIPLPAERPKLDLSNGIHECLIYTRIMPCSSCCVSYLVHRWISRILYLVNQITTSSIPVSRACGHESSGTHLFVRVSYTSKSSFRQCIPRYWIATNTSCAVELLHIASRRRSLTAAELRGLRLQMDSP